MSKKDIKPIKEPKEKKIEIDTPIGGITVDTGSKTIDVVLFVATVAVILTGVYLYFF